MTRKAATPTTETLDLAHIIDETLTSGRENPDQWVVSDDAHKVLQGALVEYKRLFPKSEHLRKRAGFGWYTEGQAFDWRLQARSWIYRCKFCHTDLGEVSTKSGESRLPKAFVDKLDRHCLRCAVALLLWSERMAKIAVPTDEVPCPAARQPRRGRAKTTRSTRRARREAAHCIECSAPTVGGFRCTACYYREMTRMSR